MDYVHSICIRTWKRIISRFWLRIPSIVVLEHIHHWNLSTTWDNLIISLHQLGMSWKGFGRHKWARAFFRRKSYSIITANISKSMNSTMKEAWELPVIKLLESICSLVQKWFNERRTKWNFQHMGLSIYAKDMIQ